MAKHYYPPSSRPNDGEGGRIVCGGRSRRGQGRRPHILVGTPRRAAEGIKMPQGRWLLQLLLLTIHCHRCAQASVLFPAWGTRTAGRQRATFSSFVEDQPTPRCRLSFLSFRGGGQDEEEGPRADESARVTRRRRRSKKGRKLTPPASSSLSSRTTLERTNSTPHDRTQLEAHSRQREDDGATSSSAPTTRDSSSKGRRHRRRRESKVAATIRRGSSSSVADDASQPLPTSPRRKKHKKRRRGISSDLSSSTKQTAEEGRDSLAAPQTHHDGVGEHDESPHLAEALDSSLITEVRVGPAVASSSAGPLKKRRKKKKRSKAMPSTSEATGLHVGSDGEETHVAPGAMEPALVEPEREGVNDGPDAVALDPAESRGDLSEKLVVEPGVVEVEDAAAEGVVSVDLGDQDDPSSPVSQEAGGVDVLEDGTAGDTPETTTIATANEDDDDDDEVRASSAPEASVDGGDENIHTVPQSETEASVAIEAIQLGTLEPSDELAGVHDGRVDGEAASDDQVLPANEISETSTIASLSEAMVEDAAQTEEVAVGSESHPADEESVFNSADVPLNPSTDEGHDDSATLGAADDGASDEGKSDSSNEVGHDSIPESASGAEAEAAPEMISTLDSMTSIPATGDTILEEGVEASTSEGRPPAFDHAVQTDPMESPSSMESWKFVTDTLPVLEESSSLTDKDHTQDKPDSETQRGEASVEVLDEPEGQKGEIKVGDEDGDNSITHTSDASLVEALQGENDDDTQVERDAQKEFRVGTEEDDVEEEESGEDVEVATAASSVQDLDVPEGQNGEAEDGDADGDDAHNGAHLVESLQLENEDDMQLERDAKADAGVESGTREEEEDEEDVVDEEDGEDEEEGEIVEAAAATSHTGPGVPGEIGEGGGQKGFEASAESQPLSLDGSVTFESSQGVSVSAKQSDDVSRVESKLADFDRNAFSRAADNDSDLLVSVVTWNLAEESPSEDDAAFIRKFRQSKSKSFPGSDFVLIAGQECENIKPRRTEGHRSREFRRLMIKMLGKRFVPIAMHQLGGIQLGLFCKQELISDLEHVSVADVTCGIGNVFHNKGAIGAFVQLKAQNPSPTGATSPRRTESLRLLFITAHMAAHVKNTDARDADFWRIATELEAQAPPDFLSHLPRSDPASAVSNSNEGGGSRLFDALDRVFFCGDLNYRIDVPREEAEHSLMRMNELLDAGAIEEAEAIRLGLLRHDQLLSSMAERRAFPGLAEGKIRFDPTFKYDKSTGDYDTSHKQRIPAWTDRVLFKPDGVRVLEYESVPNAQHSDHRPVLATFRVSRFGRALSTSEISRRRKPTKSSRNRK